MDNRHTSGNDYQATLGRPTLVGDLSRADSQLQLQVQEYWYNHGQHFAPLDTSVKAGSSDRFTAAAWLLHCYLEPAHIIPFHHPEHGTRLLCFLVRLTYVAQNRDSYDKHVQHYRFRVNVYVVYKRPSSFEITSAVVLASTSGYQRCLILIRVLRYSSTTWYRYTR